MENTERQHFEEQWQRAFSGAELSPPHELWAHIEARLTSAENGYNKRRVFYYQRLAASLVLICAASLLVAYWQWNSSSVESANLVQGPSKPSGNSQVQHSQASAGPNVSGGTPMAKNVRPPAHAMAVDLTDNSALAKTPPEPGQTEFKAIAVRGSDSLQSEPVTKKVQALTAEEERELVKQLIAQIEGPPAQENKKPVRPSWASVGFAGGSYLPDAGPSASASMDVMSSASSSSGLSGTAAQPVSQRSSSGTSYSIGFLLGKQLGRRWLLQSGLSYMKRRIDYESNIVTSSNLGATAFAQDFAKAGVYSAYTITNTYDLGSTSEFLSVPVQVGFILVDRPLSWAVNAGAAADLFLKNTIADKSGHFNARSETAGENTVFRTVSWSGLANTEISYRLAERYRLSLVPGVRYSFTSILKDESGSSKPFVFDIGFRLRYIFK